MKFILGVILSALLVLVGGSAVNAAPRNVGMVALTFDDGPDPIRTPIVLDRLRSTGTKATFFLVGEHVVQHPEIVKRIHDEGHVIGNHGWDHTDFNDLNYDQARKQIADTNAEIEKIIGKSPILFRYPFGNETESGNQAIRDLGMWGGVLWHWSHNPSKRTNGGQMWVGDWVCTNTEKAMVDYVVGNSVDQGLILLHDAGDAGMCDASHFDYVAPAIKRLKKKGYTFGVVEIAFQGSYANQWSWVQVVEP